MLDGARVQVRVVGIPRRVQRHRATLGQLLKISGAQGHRMRVPGEALDVVGLLHLRGEVGGGDHDLVLVSTARRELASAHPLGRIDRRRAPHHHPVSVPAVRRALRAHNLPRQQALHLVGRERRRVRVPRGAGQIVGLLRAGLHVVEADDEHVSMVATEPGDRP